MTWLRSRIFANHFAETNEARMAMNEPRIDGSDDSLNRVALAFSCALLTRYGVDTEHRTPDNLSESAYRFARAFLRARKHHNGEGREWAEEVDRELSRGDDD